MRQPAIEPLHESKPGWWIAKQLAKRLGLEAFFPWETPEQHLATIVEPMELNSLELRAQGAVAFAGRPYLEDRIGGRPPVRHRERQDRALLGGAEGAGADPLPRYTPADEPPADSSVSLRPGSRPLVRAQREQRAAPRPHARERGVAGTRTGTELGLTDGDRVRLQNADGVTSLRSMRVPRDQEENNRAAANPARPPAPRLRYVFGAWRRQGLRSAEGAGPKGQRQTTR